MQSRKTVQRSGVVLREDTGQDFAYSVGIDASITSCGVYCSPIEHGEWYGFSVATDSKSGTDTSRVLEIAEEVIFNLCNLPYPISIVTFEDYGPINKFSGKLTARAELCGILKQFAIQQLKVPIVMVPPTSLKQWGTGSGKASKDQILDAAAKLGYFPDTSDEADAYFAASLGERVIAGNRVGVSFHRVNP
jgi:hypothetical protein